MPGRWAAWMLLLVGLGCGSESEFWTWPELPAGTQTVVAGVEDNPGIVLRALRYPPNAAIELGPTSGAVTIFAYAESLEERGLQEGPIQRADASRCWARPLAPGATMLRRELGDDEWTEQPTARPPYDTFLALSACPCPRFEESETHLFGVPGNERARLLRVQDELYWLSQRGSVRWAEIQAPLSEGVPIEPNSFGLSPEDSFLDETGVLWATQGESVYLLDIETGQVQTSTTLALRPSGIDGARVDGAMQIFLATNGGRAFRLDRGVWSEIPYQAIGVFPDSQQGGRALWLGPGRGLIALQDSRALLLVEPGAEPRVIDREEFLAVSSMVKGADGLAYIGSKIGGIAVFDGREQRALPTFEEGSVRSGVVRRLFPVGTRLGFAVQSGALGEVVPEMGVCPLKAAPGFQEVFDAVGDETQTILIGQDPDGKLRVARYARLFD